MSETQTTTSNRGIVHLNDYIAEHFATFDSSCVTNGHLLYIYRKENKSILKTISILAGYVPNLDKLAVRRHIGKISKELQLHIKSLKYNRVWSKVLELLHLTYTIPCRIVSRKIISTISTGDDESTNSTNLTTKIRSDCERCCQRRQELNQTVEKYRKVKKEVKRSRFLVLKNKRLRQALDRKTRTEKLLRRERRHLKKRIARMKSLPTENSLRKEVRQLRGLLRNREKEVCDLEESIDSLKGEIEITNYKIKELEIANEYLISLGGEGEEVEDNQEIPSQRRQYSFKMRKVIYKTLISQVPVAHSGGVVNYVLQELGNSRNIKVPHKSTVARMAYELSALSSIQTAEALLKCDCATLCWDATTYAAQHANQVHISTENGSFTLSIAELAGGSRNDYTSHITSVIDEISSTYAEYSGQDFVTTKCSILSKISSTLSDRAPVNHCVVEQLKEELEIDIIELNCNLHPLDGFASHTRSALGKLDKEDGMSGNGRDCCAATFIYSISKIRYKQTGDPSGFKLFMAKNNIPSDAFVRYVGNRLHVMFRMAGSIIAYKSELLEYLERFCRLETRHGLLRDLKDDRMVAQFQALGLCGKFITGPWMTLFYGNVHKFSNLEMGEFIRRFDRNLTLFTEEPLKMLSVTSDVFDNQLPPSNILTALRITEHPNLLERYLLVILGAFRKVTSNQLSRYITGSLSNPSEDDLKMTKAACPNNIWAERSLGMTDALWRRAPNASLGFLDSKVKAKTNGTLSWLDSHNSDTQERLVNFAVGRGSFLRSANARQTASVNNAKQERLVRVGQARDKKMRKALEKNIKESLAAHNAEHSVYEGLGQGQKVLVSKMVNGEDVVGALFQHTWESDDGSNITYWGRIREVSGQRSRHPKYTIGYWDLDAAESSSEDYDVEVHALLADMVTDDLSFF